MWHGQGKTRRGIETGAQNTRSSLTHCGLVVEMSGDVVGLIPPMVWEVGLTVMNNSNTKVRPHGGSATDLFFKRKMNET